LPLTRPQAGGFVAEWRVHYFYFPPTTPLTIKGTILMAAITAAAVMALREKTGLPMMECKKALTECGGDTDQAVEWLRKQGIKTQALRADRETSMGRLAVFTDLEKGVGAMIELKCESAPVANGPEFQALANDMAKTLALGPGAASPDELLAQKSTDHPEKTLNELKDDLFNRMREVFELSRICRIDSPCGGYAHHDGSKAAIVAVSGNATGSQAAEVAKDIAMHIVALSPQAIAKEDLDQEVVNKEREILTEAARKEGKPENIIEKMIDGRLRNFFSQCVLLEQPFVKDDKQTVGKLAKGAGLEVKQMENWKLGG
jgi:elongation factor Ts